MGVGGWHTVKSRRGYCLLLVLLFLPASGATSYDDPTGDVVYYVDAQPVAPTDDPEVDVIRVFIDNETATHINIGFETAEPRADDLIGTTNWRFLFVLDGIAHVLLSGGTDARLERYVDGVLDESINVPLLVEGSVRTTTLDKSTLRGIDRAPIGLGSTITDFQLEMYRQSGPRATRWLDLAPDVADPNAFTFAVAGAGLGGLQVRLDEPIHMSNGVLGLFSTQLHITNTIGEAATLQISNTPPAGWASLVPSSVTVEAGQSKSIPIGFIPPGAHAHGGRTTWPLELAAGDDRGVIETGLDFFSVPQPAGHHPRIWLHGANVPGPGLSGATVEDFWMNALEDDPNAEAVRVIPNAQSNIIGTNWNALLRPELLQNIALIPGQGSATIAAYAEQPLAGGKATIDIVYCDPSISASSEMVRFYDCPQGAPVLLTRGEASFGQQTGGPFTLDFELPVDEASTIITTSNDAFGMGLYVELTGAWAPGDLTPMTVETPGSSFDLPLIDRAQARNHAEGIGLEVEQWQPSECGPDGGAHVVELTNEGAAGELTWAAMTSHGSAVALPKARMLEAGETASFVMPTGAEPGIGEQFGAILASVDGHSFAWLSWLHVGDCPVGVNGDLASEFGQESEPAKSTPWPGLVAMVAVLVGAAMRRRFQS